jgi:hypothetical protein
MPFRPQPSKTGVRVCRAVLLPSPFLAIWASPVIREAFRNLHPVHWLPIATLIHVAVAIFLFAAPFIIFRLLTPAQRIQIEELGIDMDQMLLMMGIAGSAAVAWFACMLFGLGGTIEYLYGWAAVSIGIEVFWCWRLWHSF